jgi:hypothetical protein
MPPTPPVTIGATSSEAPTQRRAPSGDIVET